MLQNSSLPHILGKALRSSQLLEDNLRSQEYLESVEKAVQFPEFSSFLERE